MGGVKFKEEWTKTYKWAGRVIGDDKRVVCNICGSDFSCDKGADKLKRHDTCEKHIDNVKKVGSVKNLVTGTSQKNPSIVEALKKAEGKIVQQRKTKDEALKAEAALSRLVATHNLSLPTIDCLAELLPKIFHDSDIAKQMSLHRTKAAYVLKYGLAEHELQKLVEKLQKCPFSFNIDESVKGGNSQLTIMVSVRNEANRIQKSHFATIKMEIRLTGENISDAVFQAFEKKSIKYEEKLVSDRTDGCSVMLGKHSGFHTMSKLKVCL